MGTYEDKQNQLHSFLLVSGAFTSLDACLLPGHTRWPQARGINNAGHKVGSYVNMTNPAYIHFHLEGFVGTDEHHVNCSLDQPGSNGTEVYGINNAGTMVGWYGTGPDSDVLSPTHGAALSLAWHFYVANHGATAMSFTANRRG